MAEFFEKSDFQRNLPRDATATPALFSPIFRVWLKNLLASGNMQIPATAVNFITETGGNTSPDAGVIRTPTVVDQPLEFKADDTIHWRISADVGNCKFIGWEGPGGTATSATVSITKSGGALAQGDTLVAGDEIWITVSGIAAGQYLTLNVLIVAGLS